jgi:hypothetical protein
MCDAYVSKMEIFMGLRIYICGKIERKFKKGWREVPNTANTGDGYNIVTKNGKRWYRHRLVMAAFNPAFDINNTKHKVDHVDGDKLHSAFANLRVVTQQGNSFNNHVATGVHWNKNAGKWQAQIMINRKRKHLGYFDTWEEGRAAYLEAKEKYHVIEEVC